MNKIKYEPLRMVPCYKDYLWGGNRLTQKFGKKNDLKITAESWELACHAEGMSTVGNGCFQGKTIEELGKIDRLGFWGSQCAEEHFPILVKLIDARQMLSVQVHPSDGSAAPGEQGKAEMWYIVDCEPEAFLYYGFSKEIDGKELLHRVEEGTICEVLNKVSVSKGDVFYILPGTIHAIGAGILIAEIQQNSNTTFRVYDYQRRGADGKLRPLHLERAAKVMNYKPIIPEECKADRRAEFPGFSMTDLFSCAYFHVSRIDVRTCAQLSCDGLSFQHLQCVEGEGIICCGDSEYRFGMGDSFMMPAALGEYKIEGECRVLLSRV